MRIVREHFRRLREDKRGSMVIETVRLSPGCSITRSKPASSLTGRVTELISSRR